MCITSGSAARSWRQGPCRCRCWWTCKWARRWAGLGGVLIQWAQYPAVPPDHGGRVHAVVSVGGLASGRKGGQE
eukprot:1160572-Pelagomonas_calceolata.AAC.4